MISAALSCLTLLALLAAVVALAHYDFAARVGRWHFVLWREWAPSKAKTVKQNLMAREVKANQEG